jgi:hypothetical protein
MIFVYQHAQLAKHKEQRVMDELSLQRNQQTDPSSIDVAYRVLADIRDRHFPMSLIIGHSDKN